MAPINTRKKLTLKDVAKALSITPATVSKALRDSSDISAETKERVKKACDELGYRPNLLARILTNKKSKILGVIFPDLRISFFSEAVRGMYEEASKKGYECIFLVHDEDAEKEKQKMEFLSDIGVDGILLNSAGAKKNTKLYKRFSEEGIKIISWDRKIEDSCFKSVTIDDKKASFELTNKLITQGRKNILFLGLSSGISVEIARYEGYKAALKANGIKFNPNLVIETFRSTKDSYQKMSGILKNNVKVDGVISVGGGLSTFGAGKAILDHGFSIPGDIILSEFGDNDIVSRLGVPFYTVFQNPYKLGKTALNMLVKVIENPKIKDSIQDVQIDYKILQR
jgi:LacI family transcriptional regulator